MARFPGVDYLLIDSQLSEQELMVRQTARQFVDEEVLPVVREAYNNGIFPKHLIPQLGEMGFLGANLEGYGCAGMSNVEYGLIMQELERGDSGLRSFVLGARRTGDVSRSIPTVRRNRSNTGCRRWLPERPWDALA